jgi:STE24 endopeptidase
MAGAGVLAVVTHPAHGSLAVAEPTLLVPTPIGIGTLDVFDTAVLAEVAAYRVPRRLSALVLLLISAAGPLAALALLGRRGGSQRPGRWARLLDESDPRPQPLRIAMLAGAVVVFIALLRLPLVAWLRIVHDGRFGMRTQSAWSWASDHLLTVGARAVLVAFAAAGVTWLVRRSPERWPAQLTVLVSIASLALVALHPVVVHPLLLPEGELPSGAHRDAILAVVERSEVDVPVTLGAASLRTTRRNAVATGLGPTRRIVLHDTLLDLEPATVAAITAHELAHLEHRDLARGVLTVAPVVLLASLGARRVLHRARRRLSPDLPLGMAPPTRTLLAIVCLALSLETLASPLVATNSRRIELAADARALVLADEIDPWILMLRAFTVDDLADPEPPRWAAALSSHPSSAVRIRAALTHAQRSGPPVDVERILRTEAVRPARH